MGVFSWLDCINNKQVKIGEKAFLLIPEEFGGGHLKTASYNGYGIFDGCDVYELVADWNREKITDKIIKDICQEPKKNQFCGLFDFEKNELLKQGKTPDEIAQKDDEIRAEYYNNALRRYNIDVEMIKAFRAGVDDDEMCDEYGDEYKREIGILLSCYDKNNKRLAYPIKITHDATAIFENCKYSKTDKNQGCD